MNTKITIGDGIYKVETGESWIKLHLDGMENDNIMEEIVVHQNLGT